MNGRVASEPAQSLLTLPFGADGLAAGRLVSEDDHMHQPLEEVTLLGRSGAPSELECLVRLEPLAATRELEAALVFGADTAKVGIRYGDDPARRGRSLPSRQAGGAPSRSSFRHGRRRRSAR